MCVCYSICFKEAMMFAVLWSCPSYGFWCQKLDSRRTHPFMLEDVFQRSTRASLVHNGSTTSTMFPWCQESPKSAGPSPNYDSFPVKSFKTLVQKLPLQVLHSWWTQSYPKRVVCRPAKDLRPSFPKFPRVEKSEKGKILISMRIRKFECKSMQLCFQDFTMLRD